MKQQQIVIKDNERIKNILIQVDLKNGKLYYESSR